MGGGPDNGELSRHVDSLETGAYSSLQMFGSQNMAAGVLTEVSKRHGMALRRWRV